MSEDLRSPRGTVPVDAVTVASERIGEAVVVHVSGEVDMATGAGVTDAVDLVIADCPRVLVVDMNAVSFFGSTGLNLLIRLREQAQSRGVDLRLAVASKAVLRPMQISGVDQGFAIHPSVARALAVVPRQSP